MGLLAGCGVKLADGSSWLMGPFAHQLARPHRPHTGLVLCTGMRTLTPTPTPTLTLTLARHHTAAFGAACSARCEREGDERGGTGMARDG